MSWYARKNALSHRWKPAHQAEIRLQPCFRRPRLCAVSCCFALDQLGYIVTQSFSTLEEIKGTGTECAFGGNSGHGLKYQTEEA